MNKLLLPFAALWLLTTLSVHAQSQSLVPPASATAVAVAADDTLFVALGGQVGIDRIVGDFVPRLVSDSRTTEFFKNARQDHLEQMLAQLFCVVAGGACVYTGLPMQQAHGDMDIAKGDFNAVVEVLQSSMSAQGVPFSTQNQLLARLAPMHRDIINVH